jgi:CBS domain-containing protein
MASVVDYMTEKPVCINSDDLLAKARSIIRKRGFRALPVLKDGILVGIISRSDVLKVSSTRTNLQVRGLMSYNVVTASMNDDLVKTVKKMVKYGVRQLPVIDFSSRVVGIISALDILKAFIALKMSPAKKKIGDVMSVNVVSCSPEDNVTKVWEKMISSGYGGLPVIEKNSVVGIITRMDLIKRGSARPHRESGKSKHVPVRNLMQARVFTANSRDEILSVARMMASKRILRVPVVGRGAVLEGIVCSTNS